MPNALSGLRTVDLFSASVTAKGVIALASSKRRGRARQGTGGIYRRGHRYLAQIDLGKKAGGRRHRRGASFDTREQAQQWLDDQRSLHNEPAVITDAVTDDRLADYLREWLAVEAPKGKPGRAPLAETTLQTYRNDIERHLIPGLGSKRVGELTVRELDQFASRKLAEGLAPSTINNIRGTLRSALSAAVRQDRLVRNVARYGGGVGVELPPVERFTDDELARVLKVARERHFYAPILLLARTGLRMGELCGLRRCDLVLSGEQSRLTVVWQLDKWGQLVRPKSPSARRTVAIRSDVVPVLEEWKAWQASRRERLESDWANEHGLVFTTRTGRPISKRNIARAFQQCVELSGVDHGTPKTLRSTVATQLAEAGVHPRKAQAFLGHAQMSTTMKYYTAAGQTDFIAGLLPDLS